MGANAQTTVPTFTASQVLTSDQMNQSARTGVPVFAGTVERDAAFGGTGEKTLAEGQLCYLESTNVVQYFDGASWATVGPQTLSSGLNYITGAAFSAVTSVSLPNSTFTSTYRNYRVIFDITAISAASATITMRLRASGADNTTANYYTAFAGATLAGAGTSVTGSGATSFALGTVQAGVGAVLAASLDVIDPQQAESTRINGAFFGGNAAFAEGGFAGAGSFNGVTAFDALSFICGTGNITGVYRVYGYADS